MQQPQVDLRYIPRSESAGPRVRLTVFRDKGSAILDLGHTVVQEFCQPTSESQIDVLQAFRESVPDLLRILNGVIAATPPGGAVIVTSEMLKTQPKPNAA